MKGEIYQMDIQTNRSMTKHRKTKKHNTKDNMEN